MNIIKGEVVGTSGNWQDTDLVYPDGPWRSDTWHPFGDHHDLIIQLMDLMRDDKGPLTDEEYGKIEDTPGIGKRMLNFLDKNRGKLSVSELLHKAAEDGYRQNDRLTVRDVIEFSRGFGEKLNGRFKVPYGWYKCHDVTEIPKEGLDAWLTLFRNDKMI